jgi:hypothetical protein
MIKKCGYGSCAVGVDNFARKRNGVMPTGPPTRPPDTSRQKAILAKVQKTVSRDKSWHFFNTVHDCKVAVLPAGRFRKL